MDEHEDLISRLRALGRRPVDAQLAGRHLAAMAGAVDGPGPVVGPRRHRLGIVAAFTVGLLAGTTGLASAGALPNGAQEVAHRTLGAVGVNVPHGDRYQGPECGGPVKNHGQYVRSQPKGNRAEAAASRCGKPMHADETGSDDAGDGAGKPAGGCQGPPPWAGKGKPDKAAKDARKKACGDAGDHGAADDDDAGEAGPADSSGDGAPAATPQTPAPAEPPTTATTAPVTTTTAPTTTTTAPATTASSPTTTTTTTTTSAGSGSHDSTTTTTSAPGSGGSTTVSSAAAGQVS